MTGPQAAMLPDGRRLHLNHGPIDLVVEAFGTDEQVSRGYALAGRRFATVLEELVAELPELRLPSSAAPRPFLGSTARRMEAAVSVHAGEIFLTPMAAVAGAVADEIMAALASEARLDRAYVNNGGDIALHIADGQAIRAAIAGTGRGFGDRLEIRAEDPVRGIATSGWRGRSFSLGIADAVTVLAPTAAAADAAATLIANAVNLPGHPAVERTPADQLDAQTDLGARPVTTAVGRLSHRDVERALADGALVAQAMRDSGTIAAAALFLAGSSHVVGLLRLSRPAERIAVDA